MPPRKKATNAAAAAPDAPAAAPAGDASGLTEYELQRLAHIRRNQEYMARLGVLQARTRARLQRPVPPAHRAPRSRLTRARHAAAGERRERPVRGG